MSISLGSTVVVYSDKKKFRGKVFEIQGNKVCVKHGESLTWHYRQAIRLLKKPERFFLNLQSTGHCAKYPSLEEAMRYKLPECVATIECVVVGRQKWLS